MSEAGMAVKVDECPDCRETGSYEGRVKISGRGIYRCSNGHMWQDADEVPSDKGYAPVSDRRA